MHGRDTEGLKGIVTQFPGSLTVMHVTLVPTPPRAWGPRPIILHYVGKLGDLAQGLNLHGIILNFGGISY